MATLTSMGSHVHTGGGLLKYPSTATVAVNGSSISTASVANLQSELIYSPVDGDISVRFKNYADYYRKWSDPSLYIDEIKQNGNNIKKVINPTKEDYLLAIEYGCRPEFIDHSIVTVEVLQEYFDKFPHKFI